MEDHIAHRNEILALVLAFGLVAVNGLLFIIWARERIKTSLRTRGFSPISIRWCPFGGWASAPYTTPFLATYVDPSNCIQTGRCVVVWDMQVQWVDDDWTYLNRNIGLIAWAAYLSIIVILFWAAIHVVLSGEFTVPIIGRSPVHLGKWLSLAVIAALVFTAAAFLTELIYCYQKRRERFYTIVTRSFRIAGAVFATLSLAVLVLRVFK